MSLLSGLIAVVAAVMNGVIRWKEPPMRLIWQVMVLSLGLIIFGGCEKKAAAPVIIGINPWPGYELLYLAEQKGFFKAVGAEVELQQLNSLADSQRNYINGRSDGMASTLIEVVQATHLGGDPMAVVMLPDYSNGGDVIIASTEVRELSQLKGKTVGCEISSLGVYMLYKALESAGVAWEDIEVKNVEQLKGMAALKSGDIDVFVSYPPASVDILKDENYHVLFSSADIPYEVLDTISIKKEVLDARPQLVSKMMQAWQMAYDYSLESPEDAHQIMARREGITSEEFRMALSDIKVLDRDEQIKLLRKPDEINRKAKQACEVLKAVGSIDSDCASMPNIVYQGPL